MVWLATVSVGSGLATAAAAPGLAPTAAAGTPTRPVSRPTGAAPRSGASPGKPARSAPQRGASPTPAEIALNARSLEDQGFYGQAADLLATLRTRVKPDADLDLSLALDLARVGEADSAAALLWNPTMSAALADTLPLTRRQLYAWHREPLWFNGVFDGWSWYVARARAEVAAARGRWGEALEAARQCVAARDISGKEWLLLAVCAGHAGAWDVAAAAARKAVTLDPTLPEAFYVQGLLEWRDGRRAPARAAFDKAIGLDSTYREAALAAARIRLPVSPDTLPSRFLTGARAVGMLTSAARPKPEEFVQMDAPAEFLRGAQAVVPDSLKTGWNRIQITVMALVDERGLIVLHELPWRRASIVPDAMIGLMLSSLPQWLYRPATRLGRPYPVWVAVDLDYAP